MAEEKISIDVLINTAESTKSLTELRSVTKQLQDQLKQTGLGAADISKIESALSGTREKVEDINAALNAGKDGGLQGMSNLGRNIVGSFGIATGALGLFGSKNEELNAIINKVNASVALLSGVQAAADAIRDAGILKGLVLSKAKVAATELETAETVKLTIAQRALNLVMSANPIALIITAVLAAVAAYQLWTSASEDSASAKEEENRLLAEQNRLLDESTARLNDQIQTRTKLQTLEISIAKEKGASLKQIYDLEKKQIFDLLLTKNQLLLLEKEGTKEYEKLENEIRVLKKESALLDIKFAKDSFEEQQKLRLNALKAIENFYKTSNELSQRYTNDTLAIEKKAVEQSTEDKIQKERDAFNAIVNSQLLSNAELKKAQEVALTERNKFFDNETAALKEFQDRRNKLLEERIQNESATLGKQRDANIQAERDTAAADIKQNQEEAQVRFNLAEKTYQDELIRIGKSFEDKNAVIKAASIRLTNVEAGLLEDKNRLLSEKDKEFTLKLEEQKLQLQLDSAKLRGEQTTQIELQILDNKFQQEVNKVSDNDKLVNGLNQVRLEKLKAQYDQNKDLLEKSYNEDLKTQEDFYVTKGKIDFEGQERYLKYLRDTFQAAQDNLLKTNLGEQEFQEENLKLKKAYEQATLASTLTFQQSAKKQLADYYTDLDNRLGASLASRLKQNRAAEAQDLVNLKAAFEEQKKINNDDPNLTDGAREAKQIQLVADTEDLKTKLAQAAAAQRTQIVANEINEQVQQYGQLASSIVSAISAIGESQRAIAQNNYDYEAQIRDQDYNDFVDAENQKYAVAVNKANGDKDLLDKANEEKNKALAAQARKKAQDDRAALIAQDKINEDAFENSKKLQIAQAIIQTAQSATGAFASLAGIPLVGPVLGGIAAAAAVVSGTAQINTIKKTKYVKATLPSIPAEYSNSTANTTSTPSGNGSSNSQFVGGFDFNNSALFGQAYPFPLSDQRVYVLESDITTTQGRVATIEDRNTF